MHVYCTTKTYFNFAAHDGIYFIILFYLLNINDCFILSYYNVYRIIVAGSSTFWQLRTGEYRVLYTNLLENIK